MLCAGNWLRKRWDEPSLIFLLIRRVTLHYDNFTLTPISLIPISRALSRGFSYLRYDSRGCGLSDRKVPSLSFEDGVNDLDRAGHRHTPQRSGDGQEQDSGNQTGDGRYY